MIEFLEHTFEVFATLTSEQLQAVGILIFLWLVYDLLLHSGAAMLEKAFELKSYRKEQQYKTKLAKQQGKYNNNEK